ncbi:helitron_like_N domain-containing protein [Nephila pilipes]|uniref:Helitron_like_N domain-containing protein n=1 Tax=Nephila pilipes TaxID=299642 RepID=A0A8X6IVB7_NEPPI|nr:helitron_like_N domain-containing protein [Nephila pilipes]
MELLFVLIKHQQVSILNDITTVDKVVFVVVVEEFHPRDIILLSKKEQLQIIADSHRCYDSLQYPIMFQNGRDGYRFSIKMINTAVCEYTDKKKVSSRNCYSYRIMVREKEDNHILKCRQLFHEYNNDKCAKTK